MNPYPHHDCVEAHAATTGSLDLRADGLPVDGNEDAARRPLENAERICLITNSLDFEVELEEARVIVGG